MADCFSLPNAAELVEELRDLEYAKGNALSWITKAKMRSLMLEAADAIEDLMQENKDLLERNHTLAETNFKLLAENAKLKAEMDSAVADIIIACRGERTLCGMCGNKNCEYAGDNQTYCYKCTRYEWRGAPRVEEDATD